MKWPLLLLACALAAGGCHPAPNDTSATYYIQLIRGSDTDAQPTASAKLVGQKLQKRLQCVFSWKKYWEMQREAVVVPRGQTVRERMDAERTIELESLDPNNVAVRIFSGGHLVRSRRQPAANAFCIAGACAGDHQCWFIVVRRDKPL
ncbi:MAG: hypothetical protein ACREIC_13100 [Limisphaerales bacterium]